MTPEMVNGLPVVALVKLPDTPGMLPCRHVVVCRDERYPEERGYVVRATAWQDPFGWVALTGFYCLAWGQALDMMTERAKVTR